MGSLCEFLEWDSKFFGLRIARAKGHVAGHDTVAKILDWCESEGIDCLYFLAQLRNKEVERRGFQLVDVRTTYSHKLEVSIPDGAPEALFRECRDGDIRLLELIARKSYADSRFFHDGHFPADQCENLFAAWIRHSCEGDAKFVWVAEKDGNAAGYVTCHLDDGAVGRIGLVGVGENARGGGLGAGLVNRALRWFVDQDARVVRVVTQGRNEAAKGLYTSCGFTIESELVWYHWWRKELR